MSDHKLSAPDKDAEFLLAQKMPATFSDKFHVAVGPQFVRLTFGEATSDGTAYRGAFVLPMGNALQLLSLLEAMLPQTPASEATEDAD